MKDRKFVSSAIKAIALLLIFVIFAALPYLASAQQINNFTYDGVWVNEDGTYQRDIFSWNTVDGGGEIKMQVKGGGITSVWLRVQIFVTNHLGNGKTEVHVTPLQNTPGTELEYRVKVGNTPWSNTIKLSFD